jgi:hypothetical protein
VPVAFPHTSRTTRTAGASSDSALSIFVFIDALGWEMVSRHSYFLEGIADVRSPLDTVLGYSCTCDPTILTGRLPRDHGHFSFYRFDPESSPFRGVKALRAIPSRLTDRGRVRHWISRMFKAAKGFTGYFQLYGVPFELLPFLDYTERKDLYEEGGILGGQPTVFDHFRSAELPFHRSDWRKPEVHNLGAAAHAIGTGRPRALYLYLAELDGLLHAAGTRSGDVDAKLRQYDRALRSLVELAEQHYGEVRLHVFSDHGMTDVVGSSDLRTRVEALGLRFGRDYAAVYDSTMARFWFPDAGARAAVLEVLAGDAHGRVLDDDELEVLGCDFPDRRYGEVIYLLDPGYVLDPSFMGSWVPLGMHGYHPDHADSRAAYLGSHEVGPRPGHLTDLFDLMLTDCGLVA